MVCRQWTSAGLAIGLVSATLGSGGCVALDEYRQLQVAHRKVVAEKEQLEQNLYDSRNTTATLQNRLASTEDQLRTREALANNLASENNRLEGAVSSAQRTVEDLASREIVSDPIIIESMLPAALDTALNSFASQYPSSVAYDSERGIVKWKSDLLFELGSDAVKDTAADSLRGFADIMQSPAARGFDVTIVGHTDDRPIRRAATRERHPSNWHLSVHRAISVAGVLQEQGVAATRIGVLGYGEFRPIASNASNAGRQQNRRVEIFVVPAGSVGGTMQPVIAAGKPVNRMVSPLSRKSDGVK